MQICTLIQHFSGFFIGLIGPFIYWPPNSHIRQLCGHHRPLGFTQMTASVVSINQHPLLWVKGGLSYGGFGLYLKREVSIIQCPEQSCTLILG